MNPLVSEYQFRIEMYQIFNHDLQQISAIVFTLFAQQKYTAEIALVNIERTKFMGIVLLYRMNNSFLIVALVKKLGEHGEW